MIPVRIDVSLRDRTTGERHLASRVSVLPAVPRVGEEVVLSPGGWSEQVTGIWWDMDDNSVTVECGLPGHSYVGYTPEFEDLVEIAREAGWEVS